MSLVSNLLQLIFCLIVGVASLLGALFIIGFLLATPRNEFDDDNHDLTQPIFIPFIPPVIPPNTTDECPIQSGSGMLPLGCTVTNTTLRNFTNTACDNTVCDGCSKDDSVTCCCRSFNTTTFEFQCEGEPGRTSLLPESCLCQSCEDLFVQLVFQVVSSSDGMVPSGVQLSISDDGGASSSSLTLDNAGFFSTFRRVSVNTLTVTASAPEHIDQVFNITVLPPGPIQSIVILSAVIVDILGDNVNTSLSFTVAEVVAVLIPENTVISTNNDTFTGEVTVRTTVFSANQTTYSSDLPPEIVVVNGDQQTFYEARVLALTQLVDENGTVLSISQAINLTVDFSQFADNTVITLLLYDETNGIWTVESEFTLSSTAKRQSAASATVSLSNTNRFWAIATAVPQQDICYLQVRTFEGDDGLNQVLISVEQTRSQLGDPFFYRVTGETNDGTGPVSHSVCIEVLCGEVTSGTVTAAFNLPGITPAATQPDGFTIADNSVTFTNSTEGSSSSPFYTTREQCSNAGSNNFVRFDLPLENLASDIPPDEDLSVFWYLRVEVLGCFDSNLASIISVNNVTSVTSMIIPETNDIVNIPTAVSPEMCNGQVTRRIACIEAYNNSNVTLQVEPNELNTEIGQLCYLSELTDLLGNSATRTERIAKLNLTALSGGNEMAGLYSGNVRFATLDQCQNPSSANLNTPLRGLFAQFECFERSLVLEDCPIQSGSGMLPLGCTVTNTTLRNFTNTACDNTVCNGCSEDDSVTCCCRSFNTTTFEFQCEGEPVRTSLLPESCSCQPCEDLFVQLVFQVVSSSDGRVPSGVQLSISDDGGATSSQLTLDNAGFFSTFRRVSVNTVTVTASAPEHIDQEFDITVLPPGPIQNIVILSALIVDLLGTNVNTSLSFTVAEVVAVLIPENTVISTNNDTFTGEVTVRTTVFSANQTAYSSDLPPEIVVVDGNQQTFYEARVLALTQLVDENGTVLSISQAINLTVDFSQFADNTVITLLLYDETNGIWTVESEFTLSSTAKRQSAASATVSLSNTNRFWAIATAVPQQDICYLQVRTFEGDDGLNQVLISVEQTRSQLGDPFFYRVTGETNDGTGPVSHSVCIEVLCGEVTSGTVTAAFNLTSITPAATQPDGFTIVDNSVTFTNSTEGSSSSPFYTTREQCASNGSDTFVRFDLPLENLASDIPPDDDLSVFWYLRVEVLGCFDSNLASTISVNIVTSVTSMVIPATNDRVNIPTTVSPESCNGQVTRRIACIEAYDNSNVTLQVEPNELNTEIGQLCYLSELTDLLGNSATRTERIAKLDLTALSGVNEMAGLYSGNVRFATLDQCQNPSSANLNTPLQGLFAQFECFERSFWYLRVEVLGCFDSNLASTISVNTVTSVTSMVIPATNDRVNVPTTVSPESCNGQVTRRIACIEAYDNSNVTLQVEPNELNTEIGQLCYLSELTDLLGDSATRTERIAKLDLTALSGGNEMAGLYSGNVRFATLDQCQNPSSANLNTPLRGFFAQFECFERPADSVVVDLPAGCANETFTSQTCSQVPCTTDTGDCVNGNGVQCCYREASNIDVTIDCPPNNPLTLSQPQTCLCMSCDDITIDVIVVVTSSSDGSPILGASVSYAVASGTVTDTMTNTLGMFTISAPISSGTVTFNILAPNHVLEEGHSVDLIPPGPLTISVVLLSLDVVNHGDGLLTDPVNVIDVGGITQVRFTSKPIDTNNQLYMGNVTCLTSYIAPEVRQSFNTGLLPPVIIDDVSSGLPPFDNDMSAVFYAVRIIAATRVTDDSTSGMTLTSSAELTTTFTLQVDGLPDSNTFSLLTFNNSVGEWSSSVVTTSINISEVVATANLPDTELPWAIGYPITPTMICYVQVRTFRRDNNPLSGVDVEVLQFFQQFGKTFFFRSTAITGDGSVSMVNHATCLPVVCGQDNEGMIMARYHVYLAAYPMQPAGLEPAGEAVNITTNISSANGPLFDSQAACSAALDGQYARFDLPVANPPPTDIEPAESNDGFVFLRVTWYDCFDYNKLSTISTDSSGNILAIYSINVTSSGEINNGIIDDPMTSGGMSIDCTDNSEFLTTRTACIQVEPISNVTLQVELNPDSSMYSATIERCSLNQTIGSLMATTGLDDQLNLDLGGILTQFSDPSMNIAMLNDMGIYFDQSSVNVAYDQCMNINITNSTTAELSGSIAIFSCYIF